MGIMIMEISKGKIMIMTKYQKALQYIHKVEEEYGSLSRVPEDNLDLTAARNLLDEENENLTELDAELDIEILRLIKNGYPEKEILRKLEVSHSRVEKVKNLNHVAFKPIFKYKVTRDDDFISYSSNLKGIAKLTDLNTIGSFEFISAKARTKGYQTKKVHLLWKNIPDDCIYTIANKPLYVKRGLNSWLKYEILKWRD